ncbi:type II secretion system minor pseudopilin GspI [Teredinibacter sp. KSP-S5-2]|uniref:type II secretion system minor pseudopilin GspI n=1 Tax=Teredinibacter sp. KSP-S5-2 TaxID=3034506 RepID=UPI002934E656|nr:type II secretion system minor pseudopilin GspI [Teredinibacter sp. KSP-S5-2]WNO08975.1 type II secretion system minor pseudopilin GspI [Teredinibacter sp. KSP-S5-2]
MTSSSKLNRCAKIEGKSKSLGFTLVEVMVALMVVGMALPAIVMQIQSSLDYATQAEDKTFAYWIAENKSQEIILAHRLKKKLPPKRESDTMEFGGREWAWQIVSKKVGEKETAMQQYEIFVGLEKDEWLANIMGYLPL